MSRTGGLFVGKTGLPFLKKRKRKDFLKGGNQERTLAPVPVPLRFLCAGCSRRLPPLCKGRGTACGGRIVGRTPPVGTERYFPSFTILQSAPLTAPFTQGSQRREPKIEAIEKRQEQAPVCAGFPSPSFEGGTPPGGAAKRDFEKGFCPFFSADPSIGRGVEQPDAVFLFEGEEGVVVLFSVEGGGETDLHLRGGGALHREGVVEEGALPG